MKLTLLSQSEYTSIVLPESCVGRYWIRGHNSQGKLVDLVAVEAQRPSTPEESPRWVIKSNRRYQLLVDGEHSVPSAPVELLSLYRIESTDRSRSYVLYAEPLTADRRRYQAYELSGPEPLRLTVGRGGENAIVYANKFVSGSHAELLLTPECVTVQDLDSRNNTYVNGRTVRRQVLKNGDVIYIMGLQIIVTRRYLFLNNPDGNVTVHSRQLRRHKLPPLPPREGPLWDEEDMPPEDYYYRAPRFKQDVDTFSLKLDAPPSDPTNDEVPLIMLVGPSMTMGMASVATGAFAIVSAMERGDPMAALPSVIMSLSMLLGTLVWPLITKTYQRRRRARKEARRQETYQAYLAQMERVLAEETARQEQVLRKNDVSTAEYAARVMAPVPQLWERTRKHTDFLSLRLGCGRLPLNANIQYNQRRFTVEQDNLVEAMYQFGERERYVDQVPVCLPLAERYVSGVYGRQPALFDYAKGLILQLVTLHGYDEVNLVMIYDESDEAQFSFARWLPHTMDIGRTVRYLATNSQEAKELSAALDPVIEYRKSLSENSRLDEKPYFVLLCLDKQLAAKTECVRRIQECKDNLGFSVLSFFPRLQDLPKECSAVVELGSGSGSLTLLNDVSDPPIPFLPDGAPPIPMQQVSRVLANTEMDLSGSRYTLPRAYTFFTLLDIGMIEHLNLLDRWSANDPTKSLSAPVGVDRYGEPFCLDLHQNAHGPHGLIAGMTGSGKSEFIITYLLSMAVSFDPREVAFILIDYKGGGMAKAFEHIPHTAGIITNLDGNGIRRSLASMRSELYRREQIFRDVSQQHSVSNIDIYKYQKLYREGKVTEPLPHLLIVSDEFAELKKEQPEFMSELTSTARVGRSLGVHLILATQKPGGVVDDQIRSNSRFRVCLKVQDNGDSLEMLGRPEAAALRETGRFYLQVGNNELFEMGQSAWAGAPYYPSPNVIKDRDDAVAILDTNGHVVAEANTNPYAMFKDPPKQLDVVTEYIEKVSQEAQIPRWMMWLPPIPPHITADELIERYDIRGEAPFSLAPLVGEYDDPDHQSKGVLRVPLTQGGNVIVYGSAGTGKELFLQALCYSLLKEHGPQEVNLYLVDFGAELLTAFADAPHTGDVILSHEAEKVQNLFKLMMGQLERRKKILSRFGGSLSAYHQQAERPEPCLVVVINNFAAFMELFEERTGDLNYLTREGTKYGIYFVLTCTGVNNVRLSMLQNFRNLYCLQLNNRDDYATVLGKTGGLVPEAHRGRGLVRLDKDRLLEFQTAQVTLEESSYSFLQQFSRELARHFSGQRAPRVPVLPARVTADFLAPAVKAGDLSAVPVGVVKATLEPARWDFACSSVQLVLSVSDEWRSFTDALAELVARQCGVRTLVLAPDGSPAPEADLSAEYSRDDRACMAAVYELYQLVLTRNNTYKDALEQGEPLPEFEPVLVIVQSIARLREALERQEKAAPRPAEAGDDTPLQRLQLAMEKSQPAYGVTFLVADSVTALAPFTAEPWYKAHIGGGDGIWVGGGIGSQYRLTVTKKPREYADDLEDCFGFLVRRGNATHIKFLQEREETE